MVSQSLVIGFHGCDKLVAEEVISNKVELLGSEKPWDWLGHGIYFWEDSYARAFRWAEDQVGKTGTKVTTPAVIGAVINLGNCLNLVDAEALRLVKAAHETYLEICDMLDTEPARNSGTEMKARHLDCAVMQTLHLLREEKKLPAFDSVRGFFVEGKALYQNSGFRELDHIQICIRSPKQILGYFWPRGEA